MATVNNMDDLKEDMQEASATTEQLSAGMQETAASLQEMNATSVQIEAAVDNMAKRATEGSRTAERNKDACRRPQAESNRVKENCP